MCVDAILHTYDGLSYVKINDNLYAVVTNVFVGLADSLQSIYEEYLSDEGQTKFFKFEPLLN